MRERRDWLTGMVRQFVSFGSVGLINTLIGYAVILFIGLGLGVSPYVANASGYAVGLLISFALNRRYTFSSRQAIIPGLACFLAAFAPSYALNLAVLHLGVHWLALPEALAQALAIVTYTVTFFVLCRAFVFRTPKSSDQAEGVADREPMLRHSNVTHVGQGDAK